MAVLFIFIDVISIYFGILLATTFGLQAGSEFVLNVTPLVVGFFFMRALLYWIIFKSVIRRDISWLRSFLQSVFLIGFLSLSTFFTITLPSLVLGDQSTLGKIFLFFTDLQGVSFYYIVIPLLMMVISLALHKLYKLEPW